jgi:hypothetical protein
MLRLESSGVESLKAGEAAAVRGGEILPPEVLRATIDAARAAGEWAAKHLASLAVYLMG